MWQVGDYVYSTDLHQFCRVIETQTLWGETLYRVWLLNQDTVVRVRADRLKPLQEASTSSCDGIIYIAAAARVADALTYDVLLAPIESSVIPLPHQLQALARAIANDKEIGGWQKHEKPLELSELLEENFLRYDGRGEVPSQIHSYLSTNFKELRNLPKDDPSLRAKARDRWYVPDPNK